MAAQETQRELIIKLIDITIAQGKQIVEMRGKVDNIETSLEVVNKTIHNGMSH